MYETGSAQAQSGTAPLYCHVHACLTSKSQVSIPQR